MTDLKYANCLDASKSYHNAIDITGIDLTNPCSIDIPGYDLSVNDYIYISGVEGTVELNGTTYKVKAISDDSITLKDTSDVDIDASGYTAYTGEGLVELEYETLDGLDHLEAMAVDILSDGVYVAGHTVSSGSITLAERGIVNHVGLGYDTVIKTMPVELSQSKTLQEKRKRIAEVQARILNSGQPSAGLTADDVKVCKGTPTAFVAGEAFTGHVKIQMPMGYNYNGQAVLKMSAPYPLTVLSFVQEIKV